MMPLCEDIVQPIIDPLPCCDVWTVPIDALGNREAVFFQGFMPNAKSAIVLGHHVVTEEEWQWYAMEKGGERCAADDHAASVCKDLQHALETHGYQTEIVPYPGESGLQFRFVAQSAGAGEIGTNAFLLHPEWGPRIHLRVLATEGPSRPKTRGDCTRLCDDCGACISACPAGAIQDAAFDGLLCRRYRAAQGEYTPVGPQRELRYCTICADICPLGQRPKPREGTDA